MPDINSFVPSMNRLTFGSSPESAHDIPPGKSNSLFLFCPKQKAQHGNKCYEATDSYNLHSITPHFRLYRFRLYRLSLLLLDPLTPRSTSARRRPRSAATRGTPPCPGGQAAPHCRSSGGSSSCQIAKYPPFFGAPRNSIFSESFKFLM